MNWLCLIILVTWGLDGVNTQSNVGNCTSNPCKNDAVCENTTQGYQCYCVDGYAGTDCEINFNDCASSPCFNNATCADDVAAYRCLCQPGFTGEQCQINIDDCTSLPCLRAGTCIDLINGFICECPLPYKGDNCSLLPCDISPCENEGICYNDIDLINTTRGYFCDCVTGFEGFQCEVNIDDCNSTACNGQGVCIDGINDYSCFCAPGFVGEDCQFPVNDCIDNKCRNNATCHDLHLGYWCECLGPGYEGLLCEREKDECTDWKPCQNGGTCVDKFSGYSCHCTDRWGGDNCTEKVNRCQTRNPCLNGAGCVNFNDGFICQCRPFYTGELCETEFNPCAPEYNPCQNKAECIAPQDGQYRCFCTAGFTGENCEVNVNECLSFPCENNGTCEDRIDGYICHCMSGLTGHTCTVNINECASDFCLNGAICIDGVNRFDCNCTYGYTGLFCEHIIDYCTSNPCYNGGSCNILPGGFMCDCLPPYTGVQCIDLIDACGSGPCHNNASCVSLSPGYICNCANPFTGLTCQDRIRYCDSEPCMNDAICREGIGDFFCICPPLLTGKQCTELLDYCKDTPCKNNGICVNGQFTYRCVCAYGFKGENCTGMVDFCLDKPCQNFGNCSNIPGGYKCECQNQFYGKVCESVAISSLLTYTVPSAYVDSASTNSLLAHSLTSSSLFSYITDMSWLNTSEISSLPVIPSSSFVSHRNITMIRRSSEQSLQKTLRYMSSEHSSQYTLRYMPSEQPSQITLSYMSSEQLSQNTLRYMSSEQLSQNTLRYMSSEPSSQITLRYMSPEQSSQNTLRYMSSEQSSQNTLRYMSSEPSPQITLTYMSTERSSQNTFKYMSSEQSSQNTLRYMSSEQPSLNTLRYMSSEPSSQITLRYMSSELSSQNTLRYMSTERSSQNSLKYMSSEHSSPNTLRYMSSEHSSQKTLRYNSLPSITTFDSMVLSTNMIPSYMNVSSSSIVKITPTSSSQFKSILQSIILNDSTVLKTIVKQTLQDKHSTAYSIQFNVTLDISNASFKSNFGTQAKPTVNLNKSLSTIVQSLAEQTLLGISSYLPPSVTIPKISLSITSIMSTILTTYFTTYLSIYHHRTTHSATSVLSFSHLQERSHYNLTIAKTLSSDRRSYKSSSITNPPSNLLDYTSDQERSPSISKSNILLSDISKLIYMSSTLNSFNSTVSINTLTTSIKFMNATLETVTITEKLTDIIRMKTDRLHTASTFSLPSVTSILSTASLISSTMSTQLTDVASDVLTSFIMSKRHASMYTAVSMFTSIFKDTLPNSTIDFISTIAHKTNVTMKTSTQRYNVGYSNSTPASLTEDTFSYSKISSFTSHTVKPVSEAFLEPIQSSNMTLRQLKSSKGNNDTLTPSFTQSLHSYSSIDKTLPILTKTNQLDTKPGQYSLSESSLQTLSRRYHTTLIERFHSTSIWSPHSLSTYEGKHHISPIKPTSSYPSFAFDLSSTSFLARNMISETSIESPEPSTNVLSASKRNTAKALTTHTSVGNVTSLYQRTSGTQMKSSQIYLGLENKSESSFSLRAISPTIVTRSSMNTEYPYVKPLMSNVSSSISKQTLLSQSFTDTSFIYTPYIISASNTFKSQTTTVGFSSDIPGNRCLSLTCLNGGFCEERGSAVCVCPERFSGPECKTAITMPLSQFDGNTYLEFRNYDFNGSLSVQVSFNTTQSKGMLLLYQIESSSNRVYLVIDEGILKCQLVCNGQNFTLDTRHNVNSGSLFTLTVRQTKVCGAILELTGTDLINQTMMWKFESIQIIESDKPTKIIMFLIGGSPAHSNFEERLNFTGCIGNTFINGFPIWTNDSVNNADLKACDANMTINVCGAIDCLNGGFCQVVANLSPICNCLMPFTGVRCETEILLHYPSLNRTSYLKYHPPSFYSNQSNEIYISVRPIQPDGTILFSSNENPNNQHKPFIHLFLEAGVVHYMFSCDGQIIGTVDTNVHVTLGNTSEILIRQSWTSGPGEWCNAALILNSTVFISQPVLTIGMSEALGYLYIGGLPIDSDLLTDILPESTQGFVGCVKDLQVNDAELNIISMAIEGMNIGNCDVPVCQHNPCTNGATCHSSGEDWYCECVLGYTGRLCGSRLCANDMCLHGGTCVLLEEHNDYLCLCPYGRGGVLCEEGVIVARPHFRGIQYGYTSYLAYKNIDSMRNDFEVKFNFIPDGNSTAKKSLILFLGNTASSGGGDFIALGLFKDYILFTYNLGSGPVSIWSAGPLDATMSHHNIQFGRRGRDGWLRVDYGKTTTGRSPGVLTALDTNGILYVGGTDVSVSGQLKIQTQLEVEFRGCIYDLEIRNGGGDFAAPGSPPGRADYGRSVGDCSKLSCNESPCQNGAQCIDLGSSIFCNCTGNWKNVYCTETMTVCDMEHECADGATCLPRVPDGYHCLCPLGRQGELCYEEFTISDPLFYDENSYMSFTPVFTKLSINIKLQLKPSTKDGMLFYVAKQLHSYSSDFLSLVLLAGKVQLRYHLGDKLNVLSSSTEIKSDTATWYTVEAGRNITHGFISIDGETSVAKTTGSMAYLDTTTDFYLGGVPGLSLINPSAVPGEPSAFIGCIREFIVNDKKFQLTKQGASGGRNIQDCDGTNCGYDVCRNNGTCNVISMPPNYNCTCSERYFGETCEMPIECSNYSCENGGECRQQISGKYGCSCALGWNGHMCNIGVELGTSIRLTRDSYVYYFDPFYEMANETYTNLSITFRTSEISGLLLWNGQTYSDDEDYLGLGLVAGRIKLVWNLGWYSRSEVLTSIKYNDGHWHRISIERYSQSLTLTIDGEEFKSRVSGDFFVLDTRGQYFIGNYDEGSVLTRSLGFYKEPFAGCIGNMFINNFMVNFSEVTDGRNIGQC